MSTTMTMTKKGATEEAWTKHITKPKEAEVDDLVPVYAAEVATLRKKFASGETKSMAHRKAMVHQMMKMVRENIQEIGDAVRADQGGPKLRGLYEMDVMAKGQALLDNWDSWLGDENVYTEGTFLQWGKVRKEPKGVMLVIAPWNFPFGITLTPVMMMLAMGNCVVVKPSEVAPHSSKAMATLLSLYFPADVVHVVEGGVSECTALLRLKWSHIMYTGNGAVGRIVMKAAAENLTPVTLELGGKSPVFIDETTDVENAAQKIVLGKFVLNCGQVCIAPDFVLVARSREKEFLEALTKEVQTQLGKTNADIKGDGTKDVELLAYGRIVHQRHVKRLASLVEGLDDSSFVFGHPKDIDEADKYVPPMIVSRPPMDSKLMSQEIFGPILPVIPYDNLEQAIEMSNQICPEALALYVFSTNNKNIDTILGNIISGGVCINTVTEQFVHPHLPFGGIGESGMGSAGAKAGVNEFSHRRAILTRTTNWPKALNSMIPPPAHGLFPDYLYGVFKTVLFGAVSPSTKSTIKTVVGVAAVGAAAWFAYPYFV